MNADAGHNAPDEPAAASTAGALLKAAREKQGLHIAALAAAIKVSPRKLEALEANRLDELPDATFARALAQTVCRTLKIDPRPVLERLPAAGPQPLVPPDNGINEPFREGPARSARGHDDSPLSRLAMRPMVLGAVLLLLASVALYWLPPFERWAPAPVASVPAAPAASAALPPLPAASVASGVAQAVPVAPEAVASAAVPASAPLAETVFSAPRPGSASAAAAVAALLQLRVTEASWVEVRDARGATLLSRTVSPGEQVGLDGPPPLALVIGNAAATELVFRGRPVDLAGRSRDNVARLQLP